MTEGSADRPASGRTGGAAKPANGGRALVIVESPTKAKKIAGYLGSGYIVESSYGHIRDLPNGAAEVPARYKAEPWARLGVDVDHGFAPLYVVAAEKKAQVKKLKDALEGVDRLYLATDEDREGEAIAWHLRELLGTQGPGPPDGVPRDHRAGDRRGRGQPASVGQVSSWSTRRRPAASSTASTATRSPRSSGRRSCPGSRPVACSPSPPDWSSSGSASGWPSAARRTGIWRPSSRPPGPRVATKPNTFSARLVGLDGRRVASGRDFGSTGELRAAAEIAHLDEAAAGALAGRLGSTAFAVRAGRAASRTPASRTRRSAPRHCSRKPRASSASGPSAPCRWPRSCTRTASSPTCEPTPPRCRRPRSTRPGRRPHSCTVPTTCRTHHAATSPSSGPRRRPTRRSGPPAKRS